MACPTCASTPDGSCLRNVPSKTGCRAVAQLGVELRAPNPPASHGCRLDRSAAGGRDRYTATLTADEGFLLGTGTAFSLGVSDQLSQSAQCKNKRPEVDLLCERKPFSPLHGSARNRFGQRRAEFGKPPKHIKEAPSAFVFVTGNHEQRKERVWQHEP